MESVNTNILLESGTNEFEVLEFTVGDNSFGINVAKIKEIIQKCPLRPIPYAHPCVEGVFTRREEVLTVVNLAEYLQLEVPEESERDVYMIANFNNTSVAFHVQAVESIHRLSWKDIEQPDNVLFNERDGVVIGIGKMSSGKLLMILDFEKILYDINPSTGIDETSVEAVQESRFANEPVLIAEDSVLLRKMILECLIKAGHANIISTTNGQEAWDMLSKIKREGGRLSDKVACVISDIEMPQMDGLHLTSLIKSDPVLKELPVIIFSSMINEKMSQKCTEVGADAQLSKPDIAKLVDTMNDVMAEYLGAY